MYKNSTEQKSTSWSTSGKWQHTYFYENMVNLLVPVKNVKRPDHYHSDWSKG